MGLDRTKVEIVSYDENWGEKFELEERKLRKVFSEYAFAIEHVGSTSIPGLSAKPIIDISVGVNNLEEVMQFKDKLEEIGYEYRDKSGKNGERYFFAKGSSDNRTHYLHIIKFNSQEWKKNLFFRDYLRNNYESMKEYEKLKITLSKQFADNRPKYTEAKSKFISDILKKMLNNHK